MPPALVSTPQHVRVRPLQGEAEGEHEASFGARQNDILRDALKFEDVAQVATEQGVDGATATEMDKDDWKELGVSGFKAAKVVAQLKKLV